MIENIEKHGITCHVDGSIRNYLIKNGYQPEYGARPINRLIRRDILSENELLVSPIFLITSAG